MRSLFIASVAASALMLSACAEEAEVVETEEVGYGTDIGATAVEPVAVAVWDTNNDGMFQQVEYDTWRQNGVTAWDTDADGMLTSEEFNTGWTGAGFGNANEVFTTWDDDSDMMLSNDEFFDDEEWTEWDANADGVLTNDEFGYY